MAKKPSLNPPAPAATTPEDGKPVCPYHGLKCESRHSSAWATYYYCPQTGCGFSQKRIRRDYQAKLRAQRGGKPEPGGADGAPRQ